MPTSDALDTMLAYLDTHYLEFENWGVLVALTEDRKAIFFCPLVDGKPDLDPPHLNWSQVTAPEPEFLDDVNDAFATAFRMNQFAGR